MRRCNSRVALPSTAKPQLTDPAGFYSGGCHQFISGRRIHRNNVHPLFSRVWPGPENLQKIDVALQVSFEGLFHLLCWRAAIEVLDFQSNSVVQFLHDSLRPSPFQEPLNRKPSIPRCSLYFKEHLACSCFPDRSNFDSAIFWLDGPPYRGQYGRSRLAICGLQHNRVRLYPLRILLLLLLLLL